MHTILGLSVNCNYFVVIMTEKTAFIYIHVAYKLMKIENNCDVDINISYLHESWPLRQV